MLSQRRRPGHFASNYLHASVRKMRHVERDGAAAALGMLLFIFAAMAFLYMGNRTPRAWPMHESGNHNDALLLLAKATGLNNSDEAKILLEALEDGTLDYDAVSSALEKDASRKAAKIKTKIEKEASHNAAEEKAAAKNAAAENAAAEKAAAAKASFEMRKADLQPRIDDFFDNGDDDDDDDEDDWLDGDFEDEIADGDGLGFSRGEQKRGVNYNQQGGGRAPSRKEKKRLPSTNIMRGRLERKESSSLFDDMVEEDRLEGNFEDEIENGLLSFTRGEQKRSVAYKNNQVDGRAPSRKEKNRAPSTNSWRKKMDRKGSLSLFNDMEEEDGMEPEQRVHVNEDDYGNKHRGKSSLLHLNERSKSLSSKSSKSNNRRPSSGSQRKRGAGKTRWEGRRRHMRMA